ncbi:peptidylprolyl isomerase [Nitrincola sp. MINF-07-Sa-05]|uniref:peptidylprolyl isomerase n=1 Tax=Nitrincola salilacus TaxID=3400273 RepID=UPI00391816D5
MLALMLSLNSLALADDSNRVVLKTNLGEIELQLDAENAPITVENFLAYVDAGFYNGLIFHRVIENFMIQGGGFDAEMTQKATQEPIKNESDNGLSNRRGTIAMARTRAPDSATAQFFINTVNNFNLDGATGRPGYAVFGEVVRGMDVVDRIRAVPTTTHSRMADVPVEPVVIESATRVAAAE